MEQQLYINIEIASDKTIITKSTKRTADSGNVLRDTVKLEMSVARVFHRALNRGRLTNVFEKKDYELLGSVLYKILTCGDDVRKFITPEIKDIIRSQSRRCQLSLQFTDVPQLASLPWEYIQVPEDNPDDIPPLFLSSNPKCLFDVYRTVPVPHNLKHARINLEDQKQLVIIVVTVNEAGDKALEYTDLFEREMGKLRSSYEYTDANGNKKQKLEILEIKNPSPADFLIQLSAILKNVNDTYILHYYGHAQMTDNGPEISFIGNNGRLTWVKSNEFASFFDVGNNYVKQPEIVVLQACESGQIDMQGDGVGIHLAKKGIPAVVSMQNIITETAAIQFMIQFYDSLLSGHDVGHAVTAGRSFLGCSSQLPTYKHYTDNTFGTPVLFITTDEPIKLLPQKPVLEKKSRKLQCKNCAHIWFDPVKNICPKMGCRGELVPYKEKEDATNQNPAFTQIMEQALKSDSVIKDVAQSQPAAK